MSERNILSEADVRSALSPSTEWQWQGDGIVRSVVFNDFVTAFSAMAAMALVAEKMNHHPEWSNVYNRLTIRLSTHDAGGVTEKDIQLAKKMDRIIHQHQ